MKTVSYDTEAKASKANADEVLPLKLPVERKLQKDECVVFKLRTTPTLATSPTYEFTVGYINGDEGTRRALRFQKDIATVLIGLNVTTVADVVTMTQRVLKGEALAAYNNARGIRHAYLWEEAKRNARAASEANGDTLAQQQQAYANEPDPAADRTEHIAGVRGVISYMTPLKALQRVKRYLRRHCRKPVDMSVREYFNALQRINQEEIPHLPPFEGNAQRLAMDEIIEIIVYGIPNSWKHEMTKQGFDPLESGLGLLLDFCERMEQLPEYKPVVKSDNHAGKKKSSNNNNNKKSNRNNGSSEKFCLIHGTGSHDSNDCHTLKAQAKRMKGDRGDSKSSPSKNKSWSRQSEDSKKKGQRELAAFIKKSVQKELNSFSANKRKADESDDDESVKSVHMAEGQELAAFNYGDLDDLKIDSDDETEIDV